MKKIILALAMLTSIGQAEEWENPFYWQFAWSMRDVPTIRTERGDRIWSRLDPSLIETDTGRCPRKVNKAMNRILEVTRAPQMVTWCRLKDGIGEIHIKPDFVLLSKWEHIIIKEGE